MMQSCKPLTRVVLALATLLIAGPASATTLPLAGYVTISENAVTSKNGATANLVVNQLNQALVEFPLGTLPAGTTAAQVTASPSTRQTKSRS